LANQLNPEADQPDKQEFLFVDQPAFLKSFFVQISHAGRVTPDQPSSHQPALG